MRTQLTETIEHTNRPWSTVPQSTPEEGAQLRVSQGCAEPASIIGVDVRQSGEPGCPHHWIIELAIGPLSKGACKTCGEERLFRNHFQLSEITPIRGVNDRRGADESQNPLQQREYHPFALPRSKYGRSALL